MFYKSLAQTYVLLYNAYKQYFGTQTLLAMVRHNSSKASAIITCYIIQREKRRRYMDYKKLILEILEKVKSEYTLKRVYKLLIYLYLRENEPGD